MNSERVIVPFDHQVQHLNKIISILRKNHVYLDSSETGSGKTIIALCISIIFKLKMMVIAPLTTLDMWETETSKYGIELISSMTYTKLSGNGNTCNHNLLTKMVTSKNKEIKTIKYTITDYLRKIIQEGILIVFDESHNLKNKDTQKLKAAHCIINKVININTSSRIGLLSATPCDKIEHLPSMLKTLGIIRSTKLHEYNHKTSNYDLIGMNEAFNYCLNINKVETNKIKCMSYNKGTKNNICKRIFLSIIKDYCCSAMENINKNTTLDVKNGFYNIDPIDSQKLQHAISDLKELVQFENNNVTLRNNFNNIANILSRIETSKLSTLIRLTKSSLIENSNGKVIIFIWHIASADYLYQELFESSPMVLNGQTSKKDRIQIIKNFQCPSTQFRILISNIKVGGVGISLDDQDGRFPRTVFIVPQYYVIETQQAMGRVYRVKTKSNATIRFIYSKEIRMEKDILDAIAKKQKVIEDILFYKPQFPSDYTNYIE